MSILPMPSLQDQLDAITARTRELVQPERLAIGERAAEDLFATGIEEKILPVGAQAPEFELVNFNGKPIQLRDLLSFGPVILKFFRGRWCPYCATELEAWRNRYDELRANGALLAAISPQSVRQNDFMAQQYELPFPVLSDPGCKVAEQFGLAWQVPELLQEQYRSVLVNLPYINGDESWLLPLPATYLLDSAGRVVLAEAHADFRVRPEPDEVLAAVDVLG
jgi:peroxiredoxin